MKRRSQSFSWSASLLLLLLFLLRSASRARMRVMKSLGRRLKDRLSARLCNALRLTPASVISSIRGGWSTFYWCLPPSSSRRTRSLYPLHTTAKVILKPRFKHVCRAVPVPAASAVRLLYPRHRAPAFSLHPLSSSLQRQPHSPQEQLTVLYQRCCCTSHATCVYILRVLGNVVQGMCI